MIRLVVIGVAAFLLSLGGTTGVLVSRGKAAAKAMADSAQAHPDSASRGLPAGEKLAASRSARAAEHEPAPSPTHPAERAATPVPAAGHVAGDTTPHAEAAVADSGPAAAPTAGLQAASAGGRAAASSGAELSYRQLARIFSNMKTTDAVKVMAFMSDDEVQGVLEEVGVRQAAGLLAAFPKERAAALSRRLLHARRAPAAAK
jgi:hypothetical protein